MRHLMFILLFVVSSSLYGQRTVVYSESWGSYSYNNNVEQWMPDMTSDIKVFIELTDDTFVFRDKKGKEVVTFYTIGDIRHDLNNNMYSGWVVGCNAPRNTRWNAYDEIWIVRDNPRTMSIRLFDNRHENTMLSYDIDPKFVEKLLNY